MLDDRTTRRTDDEDFKLSRIYAEGWNSANKLSAKEGTEFALRTMGTLNPYTTEPKRSRWHDGFVTALRS
jgi:hypothetical protein